MHFKVYGHRGARGLYSENTINGFKKCIKNNLFGIEFDIVVSKDHQLIVSHEPWMNHLFCSSPDGTPILKQNEKQFNLYEMDVDCIQQYDCGLKINLRFPYQTLQSATKPTLKSFYNWLNQTNLTPLHLLIELKSCEEWYGIYQPTPKEYAKIVFNFFKNNKLKYHPILIKSFDKILLNEIYKLGIEHELGLLVENNRSVKNNLNDLIFKPKYFNVKHQFVTKKLVTELTLLGISIIPWTVNSVKDALRLKELGVFSFITDYPHLFTKKIIS